VQTGSDVAPRLRESCLGVMLTHTDFDGGTLGLAWVSEAGNNAGICGTGGCVTSRFVTLFYAVEPPHFGSPHLRSLASPSITEDSHFHLPLATGALTFISP
jgi:hypothetical protein